MQFLKSFLGVSERLRLAVRMKGLYRAIMGNSTGFYTLDLGSAQGRMAAIKVRGCHSYLPCSMPNRCCLMRSVYAVRLTASAASRDLERQMCRFVVIASLVASPLRKSCL